MVSLDLPTPQDDRSVAPLLTGVPPPLTPSLPLGRRFFEYLHRWGLSIPRIAEGGRLLIDQAITGLTPTVGGLTHERVGTYAEGCEGGDDNEKE